MIEPLGKTINKGAKEGATIPEVERANELIKSAVRVVLTLKKVDEEGSSNRSFSEFTEKVINGSQTRGIVEEIELEKNLTIN